MTWKPGQSGNPSGRPKVTHALEEVKTLAREHTAAALQTLVTVMTNAKATPTARVAAANSLLDRGYGRPESALTAKVETKREPDLSVLNAAERAEFDRILDMAAPFMNKVLERNSGGSSVN
jgi:Family of unknown function (DUF5681)